MLSFKSSHYINCNVIWISAPFLAHWKLGRFFYLIIYNNNSPDQQYLLWTYKIQGTVLGALLNSFNPHKTDDKTELREVG